MGGLEAGTVAMIVPVGMAGTEQLAGITISGDAANSHLLFTPGVGLSEWSL